eukprot:NODE_635_length_5172_cov_1.001183.p5 type:complete len:111 gc:universal NODE_635_length_5172_cov_1.001183:1490-1822(+)
MIIGVLLIVFPVTILSINFGNVYNDYRVKKSAKSKIKVVQKQGKKTDRSKEESDLLHVLNTDLIISTNKLDDSWNAMNKVLNYHHHIRLCISTLHGKLDEDTATLVDNDS